MGFQAPLTQPILLNDGRELATLADARSLILSLPALHQRNAHWQHAAQLLLAAADSAAPADVLVATAQMRRAVKAEGIG